PDGHLSGMAVTSHLMRPTRSSDDPGRVSLLTWPCSDWGLPCHGRYRRVRWALTPPFHPYPWIPGGLISVALSVASRRPGVTWQSALWSSDFPRHAIATSAPRPSCPTLPGIKLPGGRRARQGSPFPAPRQAPDRSAEIVITERHPLRGADPEPDGRA